MTDSPLRCLSSLVILTAVCIGSGQTMLAESGQPEVKAGSPTLLGITMVCFFIINLAPGSPVEQKLAQIRFAAVGGGGSASSTVSQIQIDELKKQYGFDQPVHIRYFLWLQNIATLNFGKSFSYEMPVMEVILEKLPVSLQFGISSAILIYLIRDLFFLKMVELIVGLYQVLKMVWPLCY